MKEAGKYLLSFALYHPQMKQTPLATQIAAEYKKRTGSDINRLVLQAADSLELVIQGIEAAKSTDADKLIKAMQTMKFESLRGISNFSTAPGYSLPAVARDPVRELRAHGREAADRADGADPGAGPEVRSRRRSSARRSDVARPRRPPPRGEDVAPAASLPEARTDRMLALDLLVNGLIYGCFYALMAVGLAMIFGVLKVVNFAHGEFFMVGAYTYVLVSLKLGVSPWLALPGAAVAGAAARLGGRAAADAAALRRLRELGLHEGRVRRRRHLRPVAAARSTWSTRSVGPYSFRGPALVDVGRFALGPVMLTGQKAIAALRRRRAHGRPGALHQAIGVGPADPGGRAEPARRLARRHRRDAHHEPHLRRSRALLAALSGALLAPLINPSPDVGAFPAIKSYVIVVLGGMGSIWGAMIAALMLGVLEAFFSVYVSYDYRDAFGLIILVAGAAASGRRGCSARRGASV